jgi:hypothetical protein
MIIRPAAGRFFVGGESQPMFGRGSIGCRSALNLRRPDDPSGAIDVTVTTRRSEARAPDRKVSEESAQPVRLQYRPRGSVFFLSKKGTGQNDRAELERLVRNL